MNDEEDRINVSDLTPTPPMSARDEERRQRLEEWRHWLECNCGGCEWAERVAWAIHQIEFGCTDPSHVEFVGDEVEGLPRCKLAMRRDRNP